MTLSKIRNRKNKLIAKDINSAIGKAHHTKCNPPNFASKYAAGSKTTSCLAIDTNILYTPFPSAWKVEEQMIQNPAKIKLTLIMRSAGIPIVSISPDALKKPSKIPGII